MATSFTVVGVPPGHDREFGEVFVCEEEATSREEAVSELFPFSYAFLCFAQSLCKEEVDLIPAVVSSLTLGPKLDLNC